VLIHDGMGLRLHLTFTLYNYVL